MQPSGSGSWEACSHPPRPRESPAGGRRIHAFISLYLSASIQSEAQEKCCFLRSCCIIVGSEPLAERATMSQTPESGRSPEAQRTSSVETGKASLEGLTEDSNSL